MNVGKLSHGKYGEVSGVGADIMCDGSGEPANVAWAFDDDEDAGVAG